MGRGILFEVHASGCKSIPKDCPEGQFFDAIVESQGEAVDLVYSDQMSEREPLIEHATPGDEFFSDFKFCPCCRSLPIIKETDCPSSD